MKTKTTWILIADGASARVLEHTPKGLNAVPDMNFSQEPLRAQDIETDRSRGTYSGSSARGFGQGGYDPQTDPVDKREADFVKGVIDHLEKAHYAKAFDRLVIAAPAQALGDIRGKMSKQLKETVVAELSKDLTNIPPPDLPRHFEDILAA